MEHIRIIGQLSRQGYDIRTLRFITELMFHTGPEIHRQRADLDLHREILLALYLMQRDSQSG